MSKTLGILAGGGPDRFGNIVINQFVALGALRMGIADRIATTGGGPDLNSRLERVDAAIVEIGVAAGRVKGVADGCRGSDKQSQALDKLLGKAENTVAACIGKGEDAAKLMASIASAVLPGPMMDAVRERLPSLAAKIDAGELELDIDQVIHAGLRDKTEEAIRHKLSMGDGENIASAIFDLLKLPQYVVSNEPGSAPPAPPSNGAGPHDIDPALQQLRDMSRDNRGPILYNNSPMEVKNDLSFLKDILSQQAGQSVPLTLVENILEREDRHRDVAFQHGVDIGQMEEHIRHLQDQLRQQPRSGADMHSRLAVQNDGYARWMVGPEKLFRLADSSSVRIETGGRSEDNYVEQSATSNETHQSDDDSGCDNGDDFEPLSGANMYGDRAAWTQKDPQDNSADEVDFDELKGRYDALSELDNPGQVHSLNVAQEPESSSSLLVGGHSKRGGGSFGDSGESQSGVDVTDAGDQRVSDSVGSRGAISAMHSGTEVGTVEIMAQQNVRASHDRPEHSDAVQRESVDTPASGSVRRLIKMFEGMVEATTQFHTPPAFDVAGTLRPGREAATVADATRSSSVAGVGQVTTSTTRPEFTPLPRGKLNHARNEVDAQNAENEAAQSHVGQEDEMPIHLSGLKSTAVNVSDDYAEVAAAPAHSVQSGSPRAQVQKNSSVSQMFQSVQAAGEAKLRKDLITEFRTLVDFREARGNSLSAVKNQDEFRRHWESVGGLRFSPPVVPVPAGKETFLIREHELEKVYDQMAQNRSRKNTPLLHGISRQRSDRGPTMQGVERWVSRGLGSSPVPVPKASVEVETAPSISASSGGNWTFGPLAQPDLASKKLFEDRPSQILQQRIAPMLKSLVGG
ncbi:hypothetical protein [Stenotrophomonas sp. PD6]|uniref:hypothetical protein n=1 Tax=Stenotrophomonas sp. PD6 TaxID=3368612 RepID=UPI003BA1E4DF